MQTIEDREFAQAWLETSRRSSAWRLVRWGARAVHYTGPRRWVHLAALKAGVWILKGYRAAWILRPYLY